MENIFLTELEDRTIQWCPDGNRKIGEILGYFSELLTKIPQDLLRLLNMFSIAIFSCKFKILLKIEIGIDC